MKVDRFAHFLLDLLGPLSKLFCILLHLIQLNVFHGRIVPELKAITQRGDIEATADEIRQYYNYA